MERIASDPLFAAVHSRLGELVDPNLFTGRAELQVEEFVEEEVEPWLEKLKGELEVESKDGVNV